MEETEKNTVLYVDDEKVNLELFRLNFAKDYDVKIATSAKEGFSIINENDIDVIISDLRMPVMNGIEFIKQIKEKYPDKICIILSAFIEPDLMLKGGDKDLIFSYIPKPWKKQDVKKVIDDAFSIVHNEN
jgi:response regulator RpfG family c-di-GMP phosphodiesterase